MALSLESSNVLKYLESSKLQRLKIENPAALLSCTLQSQSVVSFKFNKGGADPGPAKTRVLAREE